MKNCSDKLKIVYFHHGLWSSNSPSTGFVTNNLFGFYEAGIDFTLLSVKHGKDSVADILNKRFGINHQLPIILLNCDIFKRIHFFIYIFAFFKLLQMDYDVLITRNLGFLAYAYLLKKFRSFNIYFEAHDYFSDLSKRPDASKRYKEYQREKRYIPKVNGVICVSAGLAELFKNKYTSTPVLTALTAFNYRNNVSPHLHHTYKIAYTGTFNTPHYDLELLIEAMKFIKNKKVTLLLVGFKNTAIKHRFRSLLEQFGVDSRVHLIDWMSAEDLTTLLQNCDIGLCPLVDNFLTLYSAPTKVMDYISRGIPVFASDITSMRQLYPQSKALKLLPLKARDWAAEIDRFYNDESQLCIMSESAIELSSNYTWRNRADIITDFIRQ
ncbi:MAG: glycosyltransferase [Candidatus Cloacimonetes bacterium]|nr:glycosyltransferase [Candidatus Cloacimonadota bacterium]